MANQSSSDEQVHIPVIQEELHAGKRIAETGRGVRLRKTVSEEVWRVDDLLEQQNLDIEHVPVNHWVEGEVPVRRYQGNTLIVPVLEEVLVVEKRLRVREEIRITARSHQQPVSEHVVLRSEHVNVERFDESPGSSETSPTSAKNSPSSAR